MKADILEDLVGKEIGFLRVEDGKELFTKGKLIDVSNDTIVVDSRNKKVVVSLDIVKSVREMNEGTS